MAKTIPDPTNVTTTPAPEQMTMYVYRPTPTSRPRRRRRSIYGNEHFRPEQREVASRCLGRETEVFHAPLRMSFDSVFLLEMDHFHTVSRGFLPYQSLRWLPPLVQVNSL